MNIRTSSKFEKEYKKLPMVVKERAVKKEAVFRKDPFDPRLDTHKLHGKFKNYRALTISGQYRIMFAFLPGNMVDFINVGTYDIYK